MRKVYKYVIPIDDVISFEMPADPVFLTVQMQHNVPYLWAEVNPDGPLEMQWFRVAGTGHALDLARAPEAMNYIGSFQMLGGHLVFHLYHYPMGEPKVE